MGKWWVVKLFFKQLTHWTQERSQESTWQSTKHWILTRLSILRFENRECTVTSERCGYDTDCAFSKGQYVFQVPGILNFPNDISMQYIKVYEKIVDNMQCLRSYLGRYMLNNRNIAGDFVVFWVYMRCPYVICIYQDSWKFKFILQKLYIYCPRWNRNVLRRLNVHDATQIISLYLNADVLYRGV